MPPLGRSDGPRAARISLASDLCIVAALAEPQADGGNGWQVQDVESHVGDTRQPILDVPEHTVLAGSPGARAGKELVPRPIERPLAIYLDGDVPPVRRGQ